MKDVLETLLQGGAHRPGGAPTDVAAHLRQGPAGVPRMAAFLTGADARVRGAAAETLAELAETDPALVTPLVPDLVRALDFEEIHTREQAWRALAAVAALHPEALEDEFETIRLGAFDPANASIRRFSALAIARFGAGHAERGRRAFPHLAEALRRFHDRDRPADLLGAMALLARHTPDAWLKAELWKAARKHDRHPDPAVRHLVEEIGALVR